MLKIRKQPSIAANSLTILIVGLLSVPMFIAMENWLHDFVWNPTPWQHWYGWIAWALTWMYAALFWLLALIGRYLMPWTPLIVLLYIAACNVEKKKLKREGYEKWVTFQTRVLVRSFKEGSFGNNQVEAFLNAINLATLAHMPAHDIENWVLNGIIQSDKDRKILGVHQIEISYPYDDQGMPNVPTMFVDGAPCLIH